VTAIHTPDVDAASERFHGALRTLALRVLDDHGHDDDTRARTIPK
jgi:hypothetical protein